MLSTAVFYGITRTFAVLALFGHALSFAWMLGHTVEKLLDFDLCTMSAIIALSFATCKYNNCRFCYL